MANHINYQYNHAVKIFYSSQIRDINSKNSDTFCGLLQRTNN
jgi:hypothetical protein